MTAVRRRRRGLRERILRHLRKESGEIVLFTLFWLSVGTTAFGTLGAMNDVENHAMLDAKATELEEQAQRIDAWMLTRPGLKNPMPWESGSDPHYWDQAGRIDKLQYIAEMQQKAADAMRDGSGEGAGIYSVISMVGDMTMFLVPGGGAAGTVVKTAWNLKTSTDWGLMGAGNLGIPGEKVDEATAMLQQIAGNRQNDADADHYLWQAEQAMAVAKLSKTKDEIRKMYPDADDGQVLDLALVALKDAETELRYDDGGLTGIGEDELGGSSGDFLQSVSHVLDKIDPLAVSGGGVGDLLLTPEDRQALESGQKDQVLGLYPGEDRVEPVVVMSDDGLLDQFKVLFPLIHGAPELLAGSDLVVDADLAALDSADGAGPQEGAGTTNVPPSDGQGDGSKIGKCPKATVSAHVCSGGDYEESRMNSGCHAQ